MNYEIIARCPASCSVCQPYRYVPSLCLMKCGPLNFPEILPGSNMLCKILIFLFAECPLVGGRSLTNHAETYKEIEHEPKLIQSIKFWIDSLIQFSNKIVIHPNFETNIRSTLKTLEKYSKLLKNL